MVDSKQVEIGRKTVVSYFKEPRGKKGKTGQPTAPKRVTVACPNCATLGDPDLQCPVCKGEGFITGLAAE